MVKRVATPAEHYLIVNGPSLISQFGSETLSKFAMAKLLEHKLTNRNFKDGLSFQDHHRSRVSKTRLCKMIVNTIEKELPYLFQPGNTIRAFVGALPAPDCITVKVLYDKAIIRYIRRANKFLMDRRIPVVITGSNDIVGDQMTLTISGQVNTNAGYLHYYKLLCFLPEIKAFFRCLSKKAQFVSEDAKNIARSKFSGYRPQESAQSNRRATVRPTATNIRPNFL